MTYRQALNDWLVRKRAVQAQCETCWGEEAELAIKALEYMAELEERGAIIAPRKKKLEESKDEQQKGSGRAQATDC